MDEAEYTVIARNPELSVIVPTYKEVDNIDVLLKLIAEALSGVEWQVIIVDDDSPDGTSAKVLEHARQDRRVRLIHRLKRKGLSSACIEGMLSTTATYVAVMDADLQHDETRLPAMLRLLQEKKADIVVGSRYTKGGDSDGLGKTRGMVSNTATFLGREMLGVSLTDPLSGFFMMRRDLLEGVYHRLYGHGFKILLDICTALSGDARYEEVPYRMRSRSAGESKLSAGIAFQYAGLLLEKLLRRYLPVKFVLFSVVGLSGVGVHMGVLGLLHRVLSFEFHVALPVAIFVAMTSNYILNNSFTFQEVKLTGKSFFRGLLTFYMVCAVGAILGFAIGNYVYHLAFPWWFSGLIATVVSALWNFSVSSVFTWKVTG